MMRLRHSIGKKHALAAAVLLAFTAVSAQIVPASSGSEEAFTEADSSTIQSEGSGSHKQTSTTEADTSFVPSSRSPEASPEGLYHENKWNYVEDSMDISGGIPEDVFGRLAKIRERGVLRVVTDPYFAPQEFIDPDLSGQDQYVGADMKLARLIADRMGVDLEIIPMDFTLVLSSMSTGEYDLAISALSYTPGRASSMELSRGYYYSPVGSGAGLMIREEDLDAIRSIDDLSGKNLAVQRGSLQELMVAQNVTDYRKFRRLSSMQDVYEEVMSGRADAAGVDIESAKMYIENNPDCGLAILDGVEFLLDDQFQGDRITGPKDDLELMYFVNGVINEVLDSGQYLEWFEEASDRAAELGL